MDTHLDQHTQGFLLYINDLPAGLCAIEISSEHMFEIREFYIVPYHRLKSYGKQFAFSLWNQFKGKWAVKQINGTEYASLFWQKVISEFTSNQYIEDIYQDAYWGQVTRQTFSNDAR